WDRDNGPLRLPKKRKEYRYENNNIDGVAWPRTARHPSPNTDSSRIPAARPVAPAADHAGAHRTGSIVYPCRTAAAAGRSYRRRGRPRRTPPGAARSHGTGHLPLRVALAHRPAVAHPTELP